MEKLSEIANKGYDGFECAFDLSGNILYKNEIAGMLVKGNSFFEVVPEEEHGNLKELFQSIYKDGKSYERTHCFIPLSSGRHHVDYKKVPGEVISVAEGVILRIADETLRGIKEWELERLKIVLAGHPTTGLFVVDKAGLIVDYFLPNCKSNLGWEGDELIKKSLGSISGVERGSSFRLHKDGSRVRTEMVEGEITFSDGKKYVVYIDTYFR